jgi:hypothetical protein
MDRRTRCQGCNVFAQALVVEHRFVLDIVVGMQTAGLRVA